MLKTPKRIGLILASRSGIATLSVVLVSACAADLGTGAGTIGSHSAARPDIGSGSMAPRWPELSIRLSRP